MLMKLVPVTMVPVMEELPARPRPHCRLPWRSSASRCAHERLRRNSYFSGDYELVGALQDMTHMDLSCGSKSTTWV